MCPFQVISEQVLTILAADNLDVACAAIEKAAMERAVSDVDEGFAASYEARRRHREVSRFMQCSAFDAQMDKPAPQRANVLGPVSTTIQFRHQPSRPSANQS